MTEVLGANDTVIKPSDGHYCRDLEEEDRRGGQGRAFMLAALGKLGSICLIGGSIDSPRYQMCWELLDGRPGQRDVGVSVEAVPALRP